MPLLLDQVNFDGIDTARPVLDAVDFLRRHDTQRPKPAWDDAPDEVITPPWRHLVTSDGFDHQAYTLCVVERLRDSLRRRDVFIPASRRWGDPRAQLLQRQRVGESPPRRVLSPAPPTQNPTSSWSRCQPNWTWRGSGPTRTHRPTWL